MDMHGIVQTSKTKNGFRPNVTQRFRFGTAEFNRQKMQLRIDGKVTEIQLKPLEILSLLLTHSGSIVTRQTLFDTVWKGRPTVDNVLANAISKLRTALGPFNAVYLVTHPRVGYSLDCPVEIIDNEIVENIITPPLTVIDNASKQPVICSDYLVPPMKHNYLEGQHFEGFTEHPVILSMNGNFRFSKEAHAEVITGATERKIDYAPSSDMQAHTGRSGTIIDSNVDRSANSAMHEEMNDALLRQTCEQSKNLPADTRSSITTRFLTPSRTLSEQKLKYWQVAALLFFLIAASELFLIVAPYSTD